jgi:hypothetical protein
MFHVLQFYRFQFHLIPTGNAAGGASAFCAVPTLIGYRVALPSALGAPDADRNLPDNELRVFEHRTLASHFIRETERLPHYTGERTEPQMNRTDLGIALTARFFFHPLDDAERNG